MGIRLASMRKVPLYMWILVGMVVGAVAGMGAIVGGWETVVENWIYPMGVLFLRLLKAAAVPLVVASLIAGVASLGSATEIAAIGGRTIAFYLFTTVVAISVGLALGELTHSWEPLTSKQTYQQQTPLPQPPQQKHEGLWLIAELVPENVFLALTESRYLLQVIVFSLLVGVATVMAGPKTAPVQQFFSSLSQVMIKLVELIMWLAPVGVMGLMAGALVHTAGKQASQTLALLEALGTYALTAVAGFAFMLIVVYPLLLKAFSRVGVRDFYRALFPAQLIAFSTSSSAATLPITIRSCQQGLNISPRICGFVLPLGATINMDGTALYQALATLFIAGVHGISLSFSAKLTILLMTVLASIGAPAVPSAGIVMLMLILESVGLPLELIGLLFAIDRPLDMMRTVVNVTSDATIAAILGKPRWKKE